MSSLERCLRDRPELAVVLLIDESGSLTDTDPHARRVTAAQGAIESLAFVAQRAEATSFSVEVDVMIAGFATGFHDYTDGFRRLDPDDLTPFNQVTQEFETRDTGKDTDYVAGLLGAIDVLEQRDACRLLIWFTDGRYDIASSAIRPAYEARLDPSMTGSRQDVYEAVGRAWLCDDEEAIGDQLRAMRIHVITGTLALGPPEEQLFTERITQGVDSQGGRCGQLAEEGKALGRFVNSEDADELIFGLDIGEGEVVRGDHRFILSFGMTEIRIVATTRTNDYEVALVTPTGEEQVLRFGDGLFTLKGVQVEPTWLSPQAFILVVRPDQGSTAWVGEWLLTFTPDDKALSKVSFFGDLEISPVTLEAAAIPGESVTISFRVTNRQGALAPLETELRPSVVIAADGQPEARQATLVDDGVFQIEYRIDAEASAGSLLFYPSVDLPVSGTEFVLTFTGTPMTVRVAPRPEPTTTTTPPPPPRAPSVKPESVRLPDLVGKGTTSDRDAIVVVPGDLPGCVFLAEAGISDAPGGISQLAVVVADGNTPLLDPGADCGSLLASGGPGVVDTVDLELALSVSSTEEAKGRVDGSVTLAVVDAAGSGAHYSIQFVFDMAEARSTVRLLLFLILFVALGLAGAYLLARLLGAYRTMIIPSGNALRASITPVTVTIEESESALAFANETGASQFGFVGGGPEQRRDMVISIIQTDEGRSNLPTPIELRAKWRVLKQPSVTARAVDGHTVGPVGSPQPGRDAELPVDLHGAWVLVVHSVHLPEAGQREASGVLRGDLVLFQDVNRPDTPSEIVEAAKSAVPQQAAVFLAALRATQEPEPEEGSQRTQDFEPRTRFEGRSDLEPPEG